MLKNYSKSNWYVITGAPCSGKTTIIKELENLGYVVFREMARVLIDKERNSGKLTEEIRKDEGQFQKKVLKMKIELERDAPKDKIIFFDRGIPDSIPYFDNCGLDKKEVLKFCKTKQYQKIFFLEQLPFKNDYARVEDTKVVKKINNLLRKSYKNLGYKVIDVPVASVKERIQRILKEIS